MRLNLPSVAALTLALGTALPCAAAIVDINMANWRAVGDFGAAGNSQVIINIGQGAVVTGFSYVGLTFSTTGDSWLSEFVLSVNNSAGTGWLDWSPSTAEDSGTFGPASGFFNANSGGPGPYGAGEAFTVSDGQLRVTSYLSYDIAPVGVTVQQGTLRVYYEAAPIPEPATYAMMLLGLAGVGALLQRRRG